jgi:uncharacterized protein (TIGR04552 family)
VPSAAGIIRHAPWALARRPPLPTSENSTATAPTPGTDRVPTSERVRKVRYEDFTLADLTAIRNLLRGGSVIDWHRLHFTERDEVDRFLRVNEMDPTSEDDQRRLADLRELAVEYLERHLNFHIPEELASGVPPRDLLLIASQKGKRRTYACIVLKVMHVLHHLAGRELLTKLPVAADQLFHLVEEKVLRTVEEIKGVGCQVVEFEWSRKHADSLITKLLAKKESIAADVYDNLRFRMITNNEEQLVFVLRELVQRLVPFNYVIPGQSVNDLIKIRETLALSPALQRFLPEITDLAAVAADKKPTVANEFSGPGYRVINFVADLPVRIDTYLCRTPDDPLFTEHGTVVFVLTEFQIIDARTAENNERGDNSHDKYKERQFARVKARLMHGMKDDGE